MSIENKSNSEEIYVTPSQQFKSNIGANEIRLFKRIYVDCFCDSKDHLGRVIVESILKRSEDTAKWYVEEDFVLLELNATECINPSNENDSIFEAAPKGIKKFFSVFVRFGRRLKAAARLVLGMSVYFDSDILLDHKAARKLGEEIINAVDDKIKEEATQEN